MDHPLIDLINARIAEAEAEGAFDDLPGSGAPLPQADPSQEAVLGRILQRNGAVPEAVALTRELARLREELREASDRTTRTRLITDIAFYEAKLALAKRG